MASSREYLQHVLEMMRPLGAVTSKRMFGGFGLYLDGTFFALIADDTLYFKVDDGNRAAYEARGLEPFSFESQTRGTTITSYYYAPEEVFEDAAEMVKWGKAAYGAALRKVSARRIKPSVKTAKPARKIRGKAT